MLTYRRVLVGLLLFWGAGFCVAQQTDFGGYSREQALAHSQAAIGRTLEGIVFTRSDGKTVTIKDYRGSPLVISLIYTSCHHICPSTTAHLDKMVEKARSALGDSSFRVISVGFDTENDNPVRMAQFSKRLDIEGTHWDFLSISTDQQEQLVEQLGFIYYASPKGFEHLIQASLVDETGKVYRQVYGMTFPTTALVEPMKELVFGQPRPESALQHLGNRIRLFCTVYDPATDSYSIDISVFIGTFVGLVVSILFGRILIKEWRRSLKAER